MSLGKSRGQLAGQPVREDRSENRDAEGPADRPEEGRSRGGHAQVGVADRVLHRDDEHLEDQAEAEPEYEEVQAHGERGGVLVHAGKQEKAECHHGGAHDGEDLVPPEPGDELTAPDRGQEQAQHHGKQVDARQGGGNAVHDLKEQRDEGERAEQREASDEANRRSDAEHAGREQAQRQHRLGRAPLGQRPPDGGGDGGDPKADDHAGSPRVRGAPPGGQQDHAGGRTARSSVPR